jgi:hypothetical protein
LFFRRLGGGYFKNGRAASQWADESLACLDRLTYYKSRAEALDRFSRYFLGRIPRDGLFFSSSLNQMAVSVPGVPSVAYFAVIYAVVVLLMRKNGGSASALADDEIGRAARRRSFVKGLPRAASSRSV